MNLVTEPSVSLVSSVSTLRDSLESIKNTDPHDMSNMEAGDEFRQGDLRFIRLSDKQFKSLGLHHSRITGTQLAEGDTQGSRHCLDARDDKITLWELREGNRLDGPIIEAKRTFSILHPEHGHMINIPEGKYACIFQRRQLFNQPEEIQRQVD